MTYVEHHQTVRDYQRSLPQYLDLELGRQYKGWLNFTKREQDECRNLERNAMLSEGYVQQPNGGWIKPRAPITRKTTAFPKIKATVIEQGNGLPGIGELCYDTNSDTVYTVAAWDGSDRISTNGPGVGNSVNVILEERGCASDTTDEEWETIESNNYRVDAGEEYADGTVILR